METSYSKRRRLPHFDKPWAIYYVTIPTRARRELSPAARAAVLDSARHFHDRRCDLFAACVMPGTAGGTPDLPGNLRRNVLGQTAA